MKCIFCGSQDSRVIDSRSTDEGTSIRRRRECQVCNKRFTTYEIIESTPILIIKKDGARQPFDPMKIKVGVIKACEKRPVSMAKIDALVSDVEKQVYNTLEQEISSTRIGEMVMACLKNLDEVAYIRFASVYRQFKDVTTFVNFIKDFEKIIKE